MKQGRQRSIFKIVLVFFIVYISVGIILWLIQDLILFHPSPLAVDYKFQFEQPFEEVSIPVDDRNLHMVKFPAEGNPKGIVLFFHGNRKNVEHYKRYPSFFTSHGYDVWMPDFPGFGKSTGERTEKKMYDDAILIYNLASQKFDSSSIIIYGKSIGTGVASFLASEKPSAALILETPYYSIDALAKHYFPVYPVIPMTKYSFPIHQYLSRVSSHITIFHGTKDEVIPYAQAEKLARENSNTELITFSGGKHNNLSGFPLYKKKIDSLLP
jgi:uncharacterized protein